MNEAHEPTPPLDTVPQPWHDLLLLACRTSEAAMALIETHGWKPEHTNHWHTTWNTLGEHATTLAMWLAATTEGARACEGIAAAATAGLADEIADYLAEIDNA